MIKTTYSVISNQNLTMTLRKLSQSQMNTKAAYRIKKMIDALEKILKVSSEAYRIEIGKQFGELDSKGEMIPDGTSDFGFKLKEGIDPATVTAAVEAFGKHEAVIEQYPLMISDLSEVKMSPGELTALGDFLIEEPQNICADENVTQLRR